MFELPYSYVIHLHDRTQRQPAEPAKAEAAEHIARMARQSAGLLMYRRGERGLEVLLAHPGGPFFANKDAGAWSVPKGEPEQGEALIDCALREFEEEIGIRVERSALHELGEVTQRGGKRVTAWAFEGDFSGELPHTSTVEMEWPPRSGRTIRFPEIDRVAFLPLDQARAKINPAQQAFLDRLPDRE